MSKIKQWKLKTKIFACLGVVLLGIVSLWGYNYYMEQQKVNNLYKHGFRLLEEQIATYIVENYSGVSKIEFSPIFSSGGGSHTFLNLDVVTKIYDEHGNSALLSGKIGEVGYGPDGLMGGIESLDFDYAGNEVIYLSDSAQGGEIDVSGHKHLPDEAKLSHNPGTDEIIAILVEEGKLKDVEKHKEGSPEAEVIYNLNIKRGSWSEWQ